MMNQVISFSLRVRGVILLFMVALMVLGIYQYRNMAVDAFPDISPIMVPVFVEAHGMAQEEIERLITFPIENAMNGLPGVVHIKSTSAFGLAVVYVYFSDRTDIYFARQLVAERLAASQAALPVLHDPPMLGPISTGLGQIFMYYLTADENVDTGGLPVDVYLRDMNDWVVKYQLQSVPGVTDILSIGGHVLQYQIRVNPFLLQKYNISLAEMIESVRANNRNAGGQFMVLGAEEALVRGIGMIRDLGELRDVPIRVVDGVPLTVGAVAEVTTGEEVRRGVVTRNGEGEVVSGLVLKLYGENTSEVIRALHEKVDRIQSALPRGVHLVAFYDQAELVANATGTVKKALMGGGLLVVISLILFMGNFRSAMIVVLTLPVSALIAVIMMGVQGVSANLMSLGGIAVAIGMLGDGAVVMVENILRHLGKPGSAGRDKVRVVLDAASEVSRPIFFSVAIIIVVFLPIYTLEGVEGIMFRPMAFTITFALLGSMAAALVFSPVLSCYVLPQRETNEHFIMRQLKRIYRVVLLGVLRRKVAVALAAIVVFLSSLALLPRIGTEFIPTLEEGSLLIGVTLAPSISLEKATETILLLEREIMEFPDVREVVSRIGRPEAGSHPHPVNTAEMQVTFRDGFEKKAELISAIEEKLSAFPGVLLNFTQPIQNAFDELLSGVKAQLAIKLFGEDLSTLQALADNVRDAILDIPGLVDLSVEQSLGQPQLQIIVDRPAAARYGVTVNDVLELVELAIGGEPIDHLYRNTRRYGIQLRYQENYRADPDTIKTLLVPNSSGALVALEQVADIRLVDGPMQINRENNQRRWIVQGNVRGRDLGGVADDIKNRIESLVNLPPGYFVEVGGQFENQKRAMKRLSIIMPIVLASVFFLLWLTFGSWRDAAVIFINVPLALVGGILGLYFSGLHLSVPASVGFIALFGIAVQNGVVMVSYFNYLRLQKREAMDAIIDGAMLRLRPVLMTAFTTVLGLLPLLVSQGIGSEVQRPLAMVVVCGLSTSTLLTLLVLPAVYGLIETRTPDRFEALTD
ncbi:MAG TPA: CusA/CzcA family heavy metal efflux RND transporter [Kiritimatiellia bacterium]|nr:CusA/CzcA family heavy metal efflux RND transporter [Kiritimatiellia bacterium]